MADPILVAQSKDPIFLLLKMANRHGLIAGATGTGKTVTLQTLAENFSARGVPVFMADVKGDLAGLSQQGGTIRKWSSARKSLRLTISKAKPARSCFGMYSASKDTRCAPRCRRWARCCLGVYSN